MTAKGFSESRDQRSTEIVTVLGKTGSKQVVVETGKKIKHTRRRLHLIESTFRERLTPAPDPNDAKPEVVPPYAGSKDNNLFNLPLCRENANQLVDMDDDVRDL
jgi:hypothetical protein